MGYVIERVLGNLLDILPSRGAGIVISKPKIPAESPLEN